MYKHNPDHEPEPNDDASGQARSWNNRDWQLYLHIAESELMQFMMLYQKLRNEENHLSKIAYLLRSQSLEWVVVAQNPNGFSQESIAQINKTIDALVCTLNVKNQAPYTLHRNLGFLMMKGMMTHLMTIWELLLKETGGLLNNQSVYAYMMVTRSLEQQMILAFACQETGDLHLCMYHIKRALGVANELLKVIQDLPGALMSLVEAFKKDSVKVCFDLREVCLQTLQGCREEINNPEEIDGFDGDDETD